MSTRNLPPPLTVGEFLVHLQAGRQAREFGSAPGVNTLCNLSLAWFGEELTAATFKRLRFEGALRLGKYLDGDDPKSIDSQSIYILAKMLRATKDRFGSLLPPPIEAVENADAVVRADTTEADGDHAEAKQSEGTEQRRQKKRGRPSDTDPEADKRLCRDWQAAKRQGMPRDAFARERGITVQKLIDAQHREKYRRVRDAE